jgi:hypothetical protein
MAMGGFTGSDPTPTLDELKAYVSSGRLRFIIAGAQLGFGAGFGGGGDTDRTTWVTTACKPVTVPGGYSGGLYDCAGAQ